MKPSNLHTLLKLPKKKKVPKCHYEVNQKPKLATILDF